MKTKQYIFDTMLFCASAAFISCSSENDEIVQTPVEPTAEEVFTTITVGAPTIEADGAGKTRVAFTYDDGMTMEWEASDNIYISSFGLGTGSGSTPNISYNRKGSATYTTTEGGATATFTTESDLDDGKKTGYYVISYNLDISSNPHKTYGYNAWKKKVIATEQTQAGNDNTAHLKDNYMALLLNVNSYTDPTFSQTWATANKSDALPEHSEVEKTTGTVPVSEVGKFIQSSCLKFDFQLPMDANLTAVKKMVVEAKNSSDENANIFYNTSDHSDSPTNTITLNFTGLDTFSGNVKSQNLVGYFMLPAADWTIPANTTLNVKVFYGTGASDYIAKALTITSEKTLAAGKLGVFKSAKTTGWTGTSTSKLWSFNTLTTGAKYDTESNSAIQVEESGLYMIGAKNSSNRSVSIAEGSGTKTFSNDAGGNSVTISKYAVIPQFSDMTLATALSSYHSATDSGNDFRGQITFDVTQAGTLYVIAKAASGGTMKVVFQATDGTYGAETTSTSTSDTELSCVATDPGTFRLYSATKGMNVYAIKFVPSN